MKVEEYSSYLQAIGKDDAFFETEIKRILALEKECDLDLDDYIPFDDDYKKVSALNAKMPEKLQFDERVQFAINRYMRYRLEVGTSLLRRKFSSLTEFREKCRLAEPKEIATFSGEKYVVSFSDRYGDERLYFVRAEEFNPDLLEEGDFISECDVEKFADCFPAFTPRVEGEIEYAYRITEKCGTLLPKTLMPNYDPSYISLLYAFVNAIAYNLS